METNFTIDLGAQVTDSISGFKGTVTGRVQYISGCNQYLLTPPCSGGSFVEPHWFDEDRLIIQADEPPAGLPGLNRGPDLAPPIR